MAQKPAEKLKPSFSKRIKGFFTGVKKWVSYLVNEKLKSPLSWRSIFWDGNIANEFPDQLMRTFRYVIGLTYVTHLIGITSVGLFLVIDGIHSIYRNRFETALTIHWTDDIPRIARSLLGFFLIIGAPVLF